MLSERQARLTEAIQALQLQPDSIVKGTVTRLEDYGVFVALAGKDGQPSGVQGLIQKSELSWDRVMTVDEVVHTGGSTSWNTPGISMLEHQMHLITFDGRLGWSVSCQPHCKRIKRSLHVVSAADEN